MEDFYMYDGITIPYQYITLEKVEHASNGLLIILLHEKKKIQCKSEGFLFAYRKSFYTHEESILYKKGCIFTPVHPSLYVSEINILSDDRLIDMVPIHTIFMTQKWKIDVINCSGFDYEYI